MTWILKICAFLTLVLIYGGFTEATNDHAEGEEALAEVEILKRTVFVIVSQPDQHHTKIALETRNILRESLVNAGISSVKILLSAEDLSIHGAWTIFPLIKSVHNELKHETMDWYLFLDQYSMINLDNLIQVLQIHKDNEEDFIGYSLQDPEPTIIHHFQDPKNLEYPDFAAGFALSAKLVQSMAEDIIQHGNRLDWIPNDFSIDPQYELAKAVKSCQKNPAITLK
jgi:hypothetical protein